jgi:hypothetical protein
MARCCPGRNQGQPADLNGKARNAQQHGSVPLRRVRAGEVRVRTFSTNSGPATTRRSPGSRPHPHDRWSQSRQEHALVSWRWLLQAGRARRKKEATYDLGHHSPADAQRLRRGRCQDRRPYAPRQAGGAIARPAMEGHGWRIPSKRGTAGPHRGHIGATNDRTAADNNGHSRPAVALFTGHTLPPAAGRRDRSGLSDTEGAGGSTPPAPTTPAVSSAFAATSSLWWTWTGREQ